MSENDKENRQSLKQHNVHNAFKLSEGRADADRKGINNSFFLKKFLIFLN